MIDMSCNLRTYSPLWNLIDLGEISNPVSSVWPPTAYCQVERVSPVRPFEEVTPI
jgi:hypothetical protein